MKFKRSAIAAILPELKDVTFYGNAETVIGRAVSLQEAIAAAAPPQDAVTWLSSKLLSQHTNVSLPGIGLMIIPQEGYDHFRDKGMNLLVTADPRQAFMKIMSMLVSSKRDPGTEPSAQISPDARIGKDCYIGRNVIIEDDVVIGDNVEVLHNTVILSGTRIGNRVYIGCNNTIGNYGFGYAQNENSDWQVMEHIGGVTIGNDVEIHNNTCIDKAVMGATIIEDNVKIDNLVHVAHGVIIRRNSLIIANTVIGGNTVIGPGSWIAPTTTIKNKLTLAENTFTGIGAVVVKDTEKDSTVIGNPAESMDQYKQWSRIRKNLLEGGKK